MKLPLSFILLEIPKSLIVGVLSSQQTRGINLKIGGEVSKFGFSDK